MTARGSDEDRRVCVGAVVGAHGLRGLFAVQPFTAEPEAVVAYGPVELEDDSRRLTLSIAGRTGKGRLLMRADGVTDRDTAAALRGQRLYVRRDRLPPTEDEQEFYHADLLGAAVEDRQGRCLGQVHAIHDFGAGDLLVVRDGRGGEIILPFTRAVVPVVDVARGRLVVDPPKTETGASNAGLR